MGSKASAEFGSVSFDELRHASEEEFVALAVKAASKNILKDDSKEAVRNWRVDDYRS